ncbi:MAG TPA: VOC family protein [Candidatus Baltobacteraceae bacterium]|jgi:catechol 2,3-dioxygenase-like lactoylglutathione lyase family enzyme
MVTGMDIVGFRVGDPVKSIAFYRDVLGMVPTHVDEQGRGAEFTLSDGSTFGVVRMPETPPGFGFLLAVDDINAAVTEYRSKGLEISDVNETPVCFMAFTQDLEGNRLIVHQRKAS